MAKINSRSKGQRGERRVIDWLQPIVDSITEELSMNQVILQRNQLQSDRGGFDIVGLDWLACEVKNCETDTPGMLAKWWDQCESASRDFAKPGQSLTPVLFYMRNRRPIRVRMYGIIYDKESPPYAKDCWCNALIDISAESFEAYFKQRTRAELAALQMAYS